MIDLYNGDCLEIMKSIPDGSVDMVLCDLPYGTTKNRWDSVINLQSLWEQYERIITKNGAIILFAQTPFDKVLGASNLQLLKYEWVWDKKRPTGQLNSKFAPMKQHENILVFSKASASHVKDKSKAMIYKPQFSKGKPRKGKGGGISSNYDVKHQKQVLVENDGSKYYPKSILQYPPQTGLHPTQKPTDLLEYLIKTYTDEKMAVLDNCMGSGSTMIACLNTNRKGIGIELDKHYFDIANKRINEHKAALDAVF